MRNHHADRHRCGRNFLSFFLVVFSWGYYVFRFRGAYLFFYVTSKHGRSRSITVRSITADHGSSQSLSSFSSKSIQTDVLNTKSTQDKRILIPFLPERQLAQCYRPNLTIFWKRSVRGLWDTPRHSGKFFLIRLTSFRRTWCGC